MNFIRDNGYSERFYNEEYIYYDINEYKYWVMTDDKGFITQLKVANNIGAKIIEKIKPKSSNSTTIL